MRARFRKRRKGKLEASQELELMPMLNVFISIIPLLLLSAAFVQLAVIPTAGPGASVPAAAATAEESFALTIAIHAGEYVLEASGAPAQSIARPARGADTAALTAARAELGAALSALASGHPGHREVRIVADPTTRYEDIIDVMDAARAAGLPEAALADPGRGVTS